jgi:hypothetical protein
VNYWVFFKNGFGKKKKKKREKKKKEKPKNTNPSFPSGSLCYNFSARMHKWVYQTLPSG